MKHAWVIASMLLLAVFGGSAGAGQVVSEITEVTVFSNRAMVTRSGEANAVAGGNRFVVETDAFDIVVDSVRASVFGEGEIIGVQIVRVPVGEMPQEQIQALVAAMDELKMEKQALVDARQALSRQEAFMDGFVESGGRRNAEEGVFSIPSPQTLEAYLSFFSEKYNAIYDERRLINEKIASVETEIQRLNRELSMLRGSRDKMRTGIEILFNSPKAQVVGIEARYLVEAARWTPAYRAIVGNDASGVDLAMMAGIFQQTGEAWRDVNLTISTAVPVRAGSLPSLPPWLLDYRRAQPHIQKDSAFRARSMESLEYAAEAPPVAAESRETALSFEYTIPFPVTIPSREQETQLPLLTRALAGEFFHYTVPAWGTEAYLVCEAKADRELLPGPVNIFLENSYTGSMFLDEKRPGEMFTLGLGIDRSVLVKREKTRDKVQETAFFGRIERDTVIRELSYTIKIENLKDRPVSLKVTDRIPVSKTDRITVKDVAFSPEPSVRDIDGKTGVMQWNLELAAGETAEITIGFTVTYPKDMQRPVF